MGELKESLLRSVMGSESLLFGPQNDALLAAFDAHAIISVTNRSGVITHVNRQFCRISQYGEKELIGKTHRVINSGYHPSVFWEAMWAQIESGSIWSGQICNRAKDGSLYWLQTTIYPVREAAGEIEQFIALRTDITVQKEVEYRLRTSRYQLEEAARVARLGSWEYDPISLAMRCSSTTRAILELAPESELGFEAFLACFGSGDGRERVAHCLGRAMAKGERFDEELRAVTAKGNEVFVRVCGYAERVDDRCVRVFGIFQDVTQQRETEKSLRESEERWQFALEGSGDGVWDWDAATNEVYFSKRWKTMLGYEPDEIGNRLEDWQELVHPDDMAGCLADLERHFRGETPHYENEHRLRCRDGSYRWILDRGKMVAWDEQGRPLRVIGTHSDITHRRVLEERLRQTGDRLALAVRAGGIGIWDWDVESELLNWDDQMRALYRVDEGEFADSYQAWRSRVHPEDLRRVEAEIRSATLGKSDYNTEYRVVWPDGEVRSLRALALVEHDAKGKAKRLVGTNWDTTEATRQRERLAHLAEEAKQASKAKSQFLANMSHEIRTPMNAVIGMASLLLDVPGLAGEQRKYAEVIRSSGESLMALINDILDFSKVEAGKLELELIEFRLREMLDNFAAMLATRAREKGLSFHCRVAPDVPDRLIGDPLRLRQILLNLAGNAIKFTDEGKVEVVTALQRQTADGAVLRFSVADTGIGISEEAQSRLFEEFTQADSSMTRLFGGTGLGLAISKQLVTLMGGRIDLQSEVGAGSEFAFTANFGVSAVGYDEHWLEVFEGRRAILVAPNESDRAFIREQLCIWKINTFDCPTAASAVSAIKAKRAVGKSVDYVFYDRSERDWEPSEFAARLRADSQGRAARLIVLGDAARRADSDLATTAGACGFIGRPIRQAEVFNVLLELEEIAPKRVRNTSPRPTERPFAVRSARILLVEDMLANQLVARGILGRFHLKADLATNGEEALRLLRETSYDLALMDVQMPKMDGLEACRRIRAGEVGERAKGMPIIALTARARQEDRSECLAAGMSNYLSKPIVPEELFQILDTYLPRLAQPGIRRGSQTAPMDLPVFGRGDFVEAMEGDEALARQIAEQTLDEFADRFERVRPALESGDEEAVLRHLHTIKGVGAHCHCERLSACADGLEALVRSCRWELAIERLPQLKEAIDEAGRALKRFVSGA